MSERKRIAMSPDEVSELVRAQRKLQLGTINPDGTPHLVTMFYAVLDDRGDGEGGLDRIAFWSYRSSQKARNIERDPRVTCLLELGEDYFELRGAMIYGTIEVVTEPNRVLYVGTEVVRRMMDLASDEEARAFAEATAAKRYAYVVEPTRVASWDHRKLT